MSPLAAARPNTDDTCADGLRSQMYANREFMLNVRLGYEEGLRGEGIPVDGYFEQRGIS